MSQHTHSNGPPQHARRRREENAESSDRNSGRYRIEPKRYRSPRRIHRQTYTEKSEPNQQAYRDRQNYETGEYKTREAKADTRVDQIHHALEHMRPRHQNHAGTNSD